MGNISVPVTRSVEKRLEFIIRVPFFCSLFLIGNPPNQKRGEKGHYWGGT